jgi:hypothetical protein
MQEGIDPSQTQVQTPAEVIQTAAVTPAAKPAATLDTAKVWFLAHKRELFWTTGIVALLILVACLGRC